MEEEYYESRYCFSKELAPFNMYYVTAIHFFIRRLTAHCTDLYRLYSLYRVVFEWHMTYHTMSMRYASKYLYF